MCKETYIPYYAWTQHAKHVCREGHLTRSECAWTWYVHPDGGLFVWGGGEGSSGSFLWCLRNSAGEMLVVLFSLVGNLLHPDTFCDFPKPLYVSIVQAKFGQILRALETLGKIQETHTWSFFGSNSDHVMFLRHAWPCWEFRKYKFKIQERRCNFVGTFAYYVLVTFLSI